MRLYHFMKEKYALKSLTSKTLKVADLGKLNDPFELLGVDFPDLEIEQAFMEMKNKSAETVGIICFSSSYKNPVQWSHYSDHHKGICLVFDVKDTLLKQGEVKRVEYKKHKLKIPPGFPQDFPSSEKFVVKVITTKFKHWSYENEYRAFVDLDKKVDGLYFFDFNEDLKLVEVILGCNSSLALDDLYLSMGDLKGVVNISRAFKCPKEFNVLKLHVDSH